VKFNSIKVTIRDQIKEKKCVYYKRFMFGSKKDLSCKYLTCIIRDHSDI